MTPEEIRIELFKRRITMAEIANGLKPPVHRSAVSQVISKDIVSNRIMAAVSCAIGRSPVQVFPEYFEKKVEKTS